MPFSRMCYEDVVEFLNEIGYTLEQLDKMWEYCIDKKHPLICNLDNGGIDWRDLNTNAIKTLPEQFEEWGGKL